MTTYDVGLIPCSSSKRPGGVTPTSLYKGGTFALLFRNAHQVSKRVVIMSAKYGLLELEDPVRWYELWLRDLDETQRRKLIDKIRGQLTAPRWSGVSVGSYLPTAYQQVFDAAGQGLDITVTRIMAGVPYTQYYKTLSDALKSTNPPGR